MSRCSGKLREYGPADSADPTPFRAAASVPQEAGGPCGFGTVTLLGPGRLFPSAVPAPGHAEGTKPSHPHPERFSFPCFLEGSIWKAEGAPGNAVCLCGAARLSLAPQGLMAAHSTQDDETYSSKHGLPPASSDPCGLTRVPRRQTGPMGPLAVWPISTPTQYPFLATVRGWAMKSWCPCVK